jgi:hypothetical protein
MLEPAVPRTLGERLLGQIERKQELTALLGREDRRPCVVHGTGGPLVGGGHPPIVSRLEGPVRSPGMPGAAQAFEPSSALLGWPE